MASRVVRLTAAAVSSSYFLYCVATPRQWHFINNADLVFHEAGHVLFMFFGQFIHVLMGSGFQVLLPLLIAGYFFYTNQRLSAAICVMWAGESMGNVSVYAGDAIAMQLPLLGGDTSFHDWRYLLDTLGILNLTPEVAGAIYAVGVITTIIGAVCAFIVAYSDANALQA